MASREYHRYLKSPEWQEKRREAFRVHGRKCRRCGNKRRIEVNHLHYRTLFHEDVNFDLEVLCHECHCLHHGATDKKFKRRRTAKIAPRIATLTRRLSSISKAHEVKGRAGKSASRSVEREHRPARYSRSRQGR